jgi:hypothetical protein
LAISGTTQEPSSAPPIHQKDARWLLIKRIEEIIPKMERSLCVLDEILPEAPIEATDEVAPILKDTME